MRSELFWFFLAVYRNVVYIYFGIIFCVIRHVREEVICYFTTQAWQCYDIQYLEIIISLQSFSLHCDPSTIKSQAYFLFSWTSINSFTCTHAEKIRYVLSVKCKICHLLHRMFKVYHLGLQWRIVSFGNCPRER